MDEFVIRLNILVSNIEHYKNNLVQHQRAVARKALAKQQMEEAYAYYYEMRDYVDRTRAKLDERKSFHEVFSCMSETLNLAGEFEIRTLEENLETATSYMNQGLVIAKEREEEYNKAVNDGFANLSSEYIEAKLVPDLIKLQTMIAGINAVQEHKLPMITMEDLKEGAVYKAGNFLPVYDYVGDEVVCKEPHIEKTLEMLYEEQ